LLKIVFLLSILDEHTAKKFASVNDGKLQFLNLNFNYLLLSFFDVRLRVSFIIIIRT